MSKTIKKDAYVLETNGFERTESYSSVRQGMRGQTSSGLSASYTAENKMYDMVAIKNASGVLVCSSQPGALFTTISGGCEATGTFDDEGYERYECTSANSQQSLFIWAKKVKYQPAAYTGNLYNAEGQVLPHCDGKQCQIAVNTAVPPTIMVLDGGEAREVGSDLWPSVEAFVETIAIPGCEVDPEWTVSFGTCNGAADGACCRPNLASIKTDASDFSRSAVCDYCSLELETDVFSSTGLEVILTGQSNAMDFTARPRSASTNEQPQTGGFHQYTTPCLGGGNGGSMQRTFHLSPGNWHITARVGKAAVSGPIGVQILGAQGVIASTNTSLDQVLPVYHGWSAQIDSKGRIPVQGRILHLNSNQAGCLEMVEQDGNTTKLTSPEGYKCSIVPGTTPVILQCNDPCETQIITQVDGLVESFVLAIDKSGEIYNNPFNIDAGIVRGTGGNCMKGVDVTMLFMPNPNLCPAGQTWSKVLDALCWILVALAVGLLAWLTAKVARSCTHGELAVKRQMRLLRSEKLREKEDSLRQAARAELGIEVANEPPPPKRKRQGNRRMAMP